MKASYATLEMIHLIATTPGIDTVVVGGSDDMTPMEAIAFLASNGNGEWNSKRDFASPNTLLVY